MKYLILIGDGMAGLPLKALNGKTTLEAAKTPAINSLLKHGITGLAQNVPEGMSPGSDVASLSIFGYDPSKDYPGRAPLEAAAQNIELGPDDVAFRCNLVSIQKEKMQDFTSGHIATAEAKKLIKLLNKKLGSTTVKFYPGVSYRHLCVIRNGPLKVKCTPPHDITDQVIKKYLPESIQLQELMAKSREILSGEKTKATQIWLWGQGRKPALKTIVQKFNISGAVISAVDLIKGLGHYAGLDVINVPGATGFLDTNYAGKVKAGLKALQDHDLLILHVEAPDECGHMGNYKLKVRAIQEFDQKIVGPIITGLQKQNEAFRVLVLPDHPTPIKLKTHSSEPVPYVYYDSERPLLIGPEKYCEKTAEQSGSKLIDGKLLLEKLIYAGF